MPNWVSSFTRFLSCVWRRLERLWKNFFNTCSSAGCLGCIRLLRASEWQRHGTFMQIHIVTVLFYIRGLLLVLDNVKLLITANLVVRYRIGIILKYSSLFKAFYSFSKSGYLVPGLFGNSPVSDLCDPFIWMFVLPC